MNLDKVNKTPIINNVKNRFLPIPEAVAKGLEPEPQITDFKLIKRLGEGSFGVVNLMVHKVTKAQYAIKIINKKNKTNIEEKPYFRREIEIMYKVHHPNVVRLFGHFEDDDFCYFIMEYINKGNIYNLIPKEKTKRLTTQLVANLLKDVISAVYYLHNMNPPIIHRDIKPENVLLGEGKVAKLTDFGWSNYIEDKEERNTVCGTPIYLAPEIVNESGHNEKVDLWCIGVLLFELVTGDAPFMGNNLEKLKENILHMKIEWPRDINSDAKDLIKKILKYNPNDRLCLVEILNHPFFTNYIQNPKQFLIKPNEELQYEPFIVSRDNPKNPPKVIVNVKPTEMKRPPVTQRKRDISPIPFSRLRLNDVDINKLSGILLGPGITDEENDLRQRYNELQVQYQHQLKTKPFIRTGNELRLLSSQKEELIAEIAMLKGVIKEKDVQISNLIKTRKLSQDIDDNEDNKAQTLQQENQTLHNKLATYEAMLTSSHNIENRINQLRTSVSNGKKEDVQKEIELLKKELDDEKRKPFMLLINAKNDEIKTAMNMKDKEKTRFVNKVNECEKTLKVIKEENRELKKKLKELTQKTKK